MTARLATHPDVSARTGDVLQRLEHAGVDVEFVGPLAGSQGGGELVDPLDALRDSAVDLALVGISALRGSAADDLTTVAVLPRMEIRDVLVAMSGRARPLGDLAAGARVGLVGPRRRAFLAAHRPDLEAVELEPSLASTGGGSELDGDEPVSVSLDEYELDAVVMSALEARDAGLVDATVEGLDPKAWLPDPGQGALALIARHPIAEATALDHLPTRTALRTELALLDALEGPGAATLGCLAQPSGRWIRLWAAAASPDGRRLVRSDRTGPLDEPEGLGASVARQLTERGYSLVVGGVT